MPRSAKKRFWRKCRVYFRRFRIGVWLTLLAVVCSLVYLDLIGLPAFVKRPLLEELRRHGLNLEFSRLRLDWYHGIVADDVTFNRPDQAIEPRFTAKQVAIHPDLHALVRLQLRVDALGLRHGRIEWPAGETNAALSALNVEEIEARVRLLPGDEWSLDDFHARFAGATVSVSGSIANAPAISRWKLFKRKQPEAPERLLRRLQDLASLIGKLSFSTPPELRLVVSGDALKPETFTARLFFEARDAKTPWGTAGKLQLFTQLNSAATNENAVVKVRLEAAAAKTPWGGGDKLLLSAQLNAGSTNEAVSVNARIEATTVQTPWGGSDKLLLSAQLSPGSTHEATAINAQLEASKVQTRWGEAHKIVFNSAVTGNPAPPPAAASLAFWTNALPWAANWKCEITGLSAQKVAADLVSCGGRWTAPGLAITNLTANIGTTSLKAGARLDVSSRELSFDLDSNIDPRAIEPVLTPKTQLWLSRFAWLSNPQVRGGGALTLPSWTNRQPDWRAEVQPTLRLAGEFAGTNVAYLGVQAHWARSHVYYSNMVWRLPDLQVHRAEGTLELAHVEDDRTKDYHWHIRGPIDPRALRPLLATNQLKGFELVEFTSAVSLDGDIWGRLYNYERIGAQLHVAATNFSFRDLSVETFESEVRYTNRVLELFQPHATRGAQLANAEGVRVDFPAERIYFTNGFAMAEPQAVADAIGPKIGHIVQPYQFLQPPVAHVNGFAPLKANGDADLQIALDGGPFEWWKFKVPQITGNVRWMGRTLLLTNIDAVFYDGKGAGWAFFNFDTPGKGGDFTFTLNVTNSNLHALMADLGTHSNRMEGTLTGSLIITDASTTNWNSWNGFGRAQLADGFLWDIPLFGVFSPILDGIFPGLGSSRASEAKAKFVITNGVIYSDSLTIRSTMMRLQYEGNVGFDSHVDARVEAELLRDTWIVGRLISFALKPVTKLLEYKVTGTLAKPKLEPLYFIPKLLLLPLHPIRTIEDLLPSSSSSQSTNAPPVVSP